MAWLTYHGLHVTAFFSHTFQVQRIEEYHKLLARLLKLTSEDHPDHYDLRYTITCVESVNTLFINSKRVKQVGVGEATSSLKSFEMSCIPVSVWLPVGTSLNRPPGHSQIHKKSGKAHGLMKRWKAECGLGARLSWHN